MESNVTKGDLRTEKEKEKQRKRKKKRKENNQNVIPAPDDNSTESLFRRTKSTQLASLFLTILNEVSDLEDLESQRDIIDGLIDCVRILREIHDIIFDGLNFSLYTPPFAVDGETKREFLFDKVNGIMGKLTVNANKGGDKHLQKIMDSNFLTEPEENESNTGLVLSIKTGNTVLFSLISMMHDQQLFLEAMEGCKKGANKKDQMMEFINKSYHLQPDTTKRLELILTKYSQNEQVYKNIQNTFCLFDIMTFNGLKLTDDHLVLKAITHALKYSNKRKNPNHPQYKKEDGTIFHNIFHDLMTYTPAEDNNEGGYLLIKHTFNISVNSLFNYIYRENTFSEDINKLFLSAEMQGVFDFFMPPNKNTLSDNESYNLTLYLINYSRKISKVATMISDVQKAKDEILNYIQSKNIKPSQNSFVMHSININIPKSKSEKGYSVLQFKNIPFIKNETNGICKRYYDSIINCISYIADVRSLKKYENIFEKIFPKENVNLTKEYEEHQFCEKKPNINDIEKNKILDIDNVKDDLKIVTQKEQLNLSRIDANIKNKEWKESQRKQIIDPSNLQDDLKDNNSNNQVNIETMYEVINPKSKALLYENGKTFQMFSIHGKITEDIEMSLLNKNPNNQAKIESLKDKTNDFTINKDRIVIFVSKKTGLIDYAKIYQNHDPKTYIQDAKEGYKKHRDILTMWHIQ